MSKSEALSCKKLPINMGSAEGSVLISPQHNRLQLMKGQAKFANDPLRERLKIANSKIPNLVLRAHVLILRRLPIARPESLPGLVQKVCLQKVLFEEGVRVHLEQPVACCVAGRQVHSPREDPQRLVGNLNRMVKFWLLFLLPSQRLPYMKSFTDVCALI